MKYFNFIKIDESQKEIKSFENRGLRVTKNLTDFTGCFNLIV